MHEQERERALADISARAYNLPSFQTYRLSTLLELVAYGLKQIMSQKDAKNGLGG
jgi:hypothetical protein